MIRLVLTLLLLVGLALPAEAHKLKVFATVEGEEIIGYAFFIGGGRARGAVWLARMGSDSVGEGWTDAEGGFFLPVPPTVTADITVTVDTQEGHLATAILPAGRFGAGTVPAISATATTVPTLTKAPGMDEVALVRIAEGAVQRRTAALEARTAEMQDRIRLVDVIAGLMAIAGLAGVGRWLRRGRAA